MFLTVDTVFSLAGKVVEVSWTNLTINQPFFNDLATGYN
jgi:hypothetical protein